MTKVLDGQDVAAASSDVINVQTGTAYVVQASDQGKVIELNNAAAITVTLPAGLPVGFNCLWRQAGAGQITFAPGAGAVLRNVDAHTKSIAQYAQGLLSIDSANAWYLSGATSI